MPETCYRHPDRETAVACSSCGRPICPDCMNPTPVGMRCPDCARHRTRVTTGTAAFGRGSRTPATFALIAVNVALYLAQVGFGSGGLSPRVVDGVTLDFALFGPFVADGEWYRLLTYGFLHSSLLHIGFNMFALYFLGQVLEPGIGTPRFLGVYLASLLGGSLGALLLDPDALTVGASGAVFGVFGATFVIARARGVEALASSIGLIIGLNLLISVTLPNISLGGHLGGLVAGVVCAGVIVGGERGLLGARRLPAELATIAALAAVAAVAAVAVA